MVLEHYSYSKIKELYSTPKQDWRNMKPLGLWVSIKGEYDWPSWCKSEEFRNTDLQYKYIIELSETSNILYIPTSRELIAFTEKYTKYSKTPAHFTRIDWERVAAEYQGLIISPYHWNCRLLSVTFWYYGWDCASGCIWDHTAIKSIKLEGE